MVVNKGNELIVLPVNLFQQYNCQMFVLKKYLKNVSSMAYILKCFNFCHVKTLRVRNTSQKEAFRSSPSSFKLLCISECLQCLSEMAKAVLLFMSRFSHVSTTKQSIKKGK